METKEIEEKIKKILEANNITKVPINLIDSADHFINKLGIDSVGMVTVLTAVEKEFKVDIPPEDFVIENFANIELIVQYVNSRLDN